MTKDTAKPSRVTNVQVPGEQPKNDKPADTSNALAAAVAGAAPGVVTGSTDAATSGSAGPAVDLEAMRAQIRAEERDKARIELGQQIQAASSVIGDSAAPARSKADYRNMRAADIDPSTLTAPVMTLDGYLCPPAPEAKK